MHLDRRKCDSLQRIQNRDARVRIGCRVDDNAVKHAVGRLNFIDQRALVVGLEDLAGDIRFAARILAEAHQRGVILPPVNIRLPQAEQVEIRPVQYQQLHPSTSKICRTASSTVRSLSIIASANFSYSGFLRR